LRLYEYQAKEVFKKYGIPIPIGSVVSSPTEARQVAEKIGKPVVLKVQVLVGGRGKAGGIKFASNPQEAEKIAKTLIGQTFKGFKVSKLLVEEKLQIKEEYYLGFTIDRSARKLVAIASSRGGVDIEEIAISFPQYIVKQHVDPLIGFYPFMARQLIKKLGFEGKILNEMSSFLYKLYKIMIDYDAELIEINPLVLTEDNKLIAADARLNIDSDALFRHSDIKQIEELSTFSPYELEAKKAGLSYVELDGNIGIIGNGAGLVMTTLDLVKMYGGNPANFLDVGGGAASESIATALRILLNHPRVKVILINILGGITRCDEVAKGIISALKTSNMGKPIVIRLTGTNELEGRKILKNEGLIALSSMEEAAKKAVELVGGE